MRVPTSQSIVAGQGRLTTIQASAPDLGANVARSLQGLGANLVALAERTKQRNDKIDEFKTIQNYSEWETTFNKDLEEYKRNSPPDAKGFTEGVANLYDTKATAFIQTVPKDLQEEWKAKIAQQKSTLVSNALSFQYKQGDDFFKQGISDEVAKSQAIVAADPSKADEEVQRLHDQIYNKTDLSEDDKATLARNAGIMVYSLQYKDKAKKLVADTADVPDDGVEAAKTILRKEEGFVTSAFWDKNHYRSGYSSDTFTDENGNVRATQRGDTVTRADAERDLDRRVKVFDDAARKRLGDKWDNLSGRAKGAIISVMYNYGQLPAPVIKAVESGDLNQVSEAVQSLTANPERRAREAALISGQRQLDLDPKYSNISYEDKVKLQSQAENEYKQEATAENLRLKADFDAKFNQLLMGATTGQTTPADVRQFRLDNPGMTYDQFDKAMGAVKKYGEDNDGALSAAKNLANPNFVSDGNADEKKNVNTLFNKMGGGAELLAGNPQTASTLKQIGDIYGYLPADAIGAMKNALGSRNLDAAAGAYKVMSGLLRSNQTLFSNSFDADTRRKVKAIDNAVSAQSPGAPLNAAIDKVLGVSEEERVAKEKYGKKAEEYLATTKDGVKMVDTLMSQFQKDLDPQGLWGYTPFSDPAQASAYTAMRSQMEEDFNDTFVKNYQLSGDPDQAYQDTFNELKSTYGVTNVGGAKMLMKYPPEQQPPISGRKIAGGYDYLDRQIREAYKLPDNWEVMPMSDYQTGLDVQNKGVASYQILVKAPFDSHWRLVDAAREPDRQPGRAGRFVFEVPKADLEAEKQNLAVKDARSRAEEIKMKLDIKKMDAGGVMADPSKPVLTPEEQQQYDQADQTLQKLDANEQNLDKIIKTYEAKYKSGRTWRSAPVLVPSQDEMEQYLDAKRQFDRLKN